jgi:hypothetical protein
MLMGEKQMIRTWIGAAVVAAAAVTAGGPAHAAAVARCGMGGLEVPGAAQPGGYRCAPSPYGKDVLAAAKALVASTDHVLPQAATREGRYVVVSAAEQVVSGMNYQLVVAVAGKQPEILIGTVYRNLDGALSVTSQYAVSHGTGMRQS